MTRSTFAIMLAIALFPAIMPARAENAPAVAVGLSATEISTVDRITISLEITLPTGRTVEPFLAAATAALQSAGWTVVSSSTDSPRLGPADTLTHRATILAEPFLPGEYTIPAFGITAVDEAGHPQTIKSEPALVAVRSVLPDDEADPLHKPGQSGTGDQTGDSPLGDLRPTPDEPRPAPFIAVIAGVIAFAGIALASRAALATRRPHTPDPIRDLERLARSGQQSDSLDAVERAFRACLRISAGDEVAGLATSRVADALARRGINDADAAECARLLHDFEHTRYAPAGEIATGEPLTARALSLARRLREAGGRA